MKRSTRRLPLATTGVRTTSYPWLLWQRLARESNYVGVRKYFFGVYPAYELHGMHPEPLQAFFFQDFEKINDEKCGNKTLD